MAARKGRKASKLDDPKVKLLLNALKGGSYIEVACNYAGLSPSTIYRWLERGRAEKAAQELGIKANPIEAQYVELCEAVEKARADAIVRNVTIIQQAAGNGQWQAAAWWLERSLPQQYGRRLQAEVSAPVSVTELEQRMLALIGDVDEADLSEDESGAA